MPILIDHHPADSIAVTDRGLCYGDGVFRTLRAMSGQPRLWHWQWRRLAHDCTALALPLPDPDALREDIARACDGMDDATVRITVTRGQGARGYSPASAPGSTLIVQASAYLAAPDGCFREGIVARLCDLRLAIQPRLAGVKHLNRLENVLARAEWNDPAIREGILRDSDGRVIEGTMSNLLVSRDGVLLTPGLDGAGVSGAVRACLMDRLPVTATELRLEDLLAADEIACVNSLIGVWPLARLGDWRPRSRRMANRLAAVLEEAG